MQIVRIPNQLPALQHLFIGIAIENWVRYLIFAGSAWLLAYVFFKRRWLRRKIIAKMPASSEVWREIRWSVCTVCIYSLVGVLTIWAWKHGGTRLYRRIDAHGWAWFAGSIGIAIVVHDTWFYWTHRAMHHRRLFRWFHRTHHLSTNPSPWAAYAFSPLEAIVQALIFPIVTMTIPIHPLAFGIFMLWQIAFNVLGHTGYEYNPSWMMDSWLGKFMNTPTNHVMHHETMRGNYGLYFNVWDRLMGTNHTNYEARFREVTTREK